MNPLNAVIIDDESDSVSLLQLQLNRHCPDVKIIGVFSNPQKALEDIKLLQPDLLFLDIEMPEMNGFELLQKLLPLTFKIIFITAYNQHALRAFRFNAIDYLLKPIDPDDLIRAVDKAQQTQKPTSTQLSLVQRQMQGETATKIAIPAQNGISFIDLDEIIYAEASNNYSRLILKDGKTVIISKTLKDVQEILEERHFLRIHRQYVANLHHVKHFNRKDCILTMDNKAELAVARSQSERLMDGFEQL